jgi:archaemetzincin
VNVRMLALGDVPPRLAETVLAGLPRPYAGGEIARLEVSLERCYERTRAQVDAACLIEQVPTPEPGWAALGLTGVDLFMPALTYVFGLAELGGTRALASWARLRPEEPGPDAMAVLQRRMLIEAVHELGHCLGLVHCPVPECPMHRSMWAESVDLKSHIYCPSCQAGAEARG